MLGLTITDLTELTIAEGVQLSFSSNQICKVIAENGFVNFNLIEVSVGSSSLWEQEMPYVFFSEMKNFLRWATAHITVI